MHELYLKRQRGHRYRAIEKYRVYKINPRKNLTAAGAYPSASEYSFKIWR